MARDDAARNGFPAARWVLGCSSISMLGLFFGRRLQYSQYIHYIYVTLHYILT